MSDYKRFVSYLYEYISEKKSDNRGFVKVELRSGICYMQFQLKVFSLPERTPVTVYGFVQSSNTLKGLLLGQLFSGKNGIAGQLSFPAQIPGTAYSVPDFNGLILTTSGGKFYGTQWDETPISPQLFRPVKQSSQSPSAPLTAAPKNLASQTTQTPPATQNEISDSPQTPKTASISEPQHSRTSTPVQDNISQHTQASSPMESFTPQAPTVIENHTSHASEAVPSRTLQPSETPVSEVPTPQTPQASIEKNHTSQSPQASAEKDHISQPPQASAEKKHTIQTPAEQETSAAGSSAVSAMPKGSAPDLSGQSVHIASAAAATQPDPWVWVRQRYTAIRPFDDDEISDCVRIMINDFPELRAHGFPVGCSQFIHHAFQSYHHLLLGRLVTPQSTRYILGVPGIYNANEQFMASMFGFHYFKPGRIPKECACPGKTGYWYRPLG